MSTVEQQQGTATESRGGADSEEHASLPKTKQVTQDSPLGVTSSDMNKQGGSRLKHLIRRNMLKSHTRRHELYRRRQEEAAAHAQRRASSQPQEEPDVSEPFLPPPSYFPPPACVRAVTNPSPVSVPVFFPVSVLSVR